MKQASQFITAIWAAAGILAGCTKPPAPDPVVLATPAPAPAAAPAAAPTPAPTPVPTPVAIPVAVATPPPAAPPEPNYFAPEGVFFLVVKRSIETPDGLIGVRPGTRLQRQKDGSLKTEDGITVPAEAHHVTNDLRIAQQALASDAAAANALRQQMQKWADQAADAANAANAAYPVKPPPGSRVYTTTTVDSNGRTHSYTSTTTTTNTPDYYQTTPKPTPSNPLERGTYKEKKAIRPYYSPYRYY